MDVSFSDYDNTMAIAIALREAYHKVIDLTDIADGIEVYEHNMNVAKAIRRMEEETRHYALNLLHEDVINHINERMKSNG